MTDSSLVPSGTASFANTNLVPALITNSGDAADWRYIEFLSPLAVLRVCASISTETDDAAGTAERFASAG